MFFFALPVQVGGIAYLGLYLLFGIPEIVVCNKGNDDAFRASRRNFERFSVVIQLVRIFPAHSVALLALGGLGYIWQAELLLF